MASNQGALCDPDRPRALEPSRPGADPQSSFNLKSTVHNTYPSAAKLPDFKRALGDLTRLRQTGSSGLINLECIINRPMLPNQHTLVAQWPSGSCLVKSPPWKSPVVIRCAGSQLLQPSTVEPGSSETCRRSKDLLGCLASDRRCSAHLSLDNSTTR